MVFVTVTFVSDLDNVSYVPQMRRSDDAGAAVSATGDARCDGHTHGVF